MNLEEILHDPRFSLPLENTGKIDFLTFLTAHFDEYIGELTRDRALLGPYRIQSMLTDEFISTSRQIADDVLKILQLRFSGNPDYWQKFERFIDNLTWVMMIPQSYIADLPKDAVYYRCAGYDTIIPKDWFFHLPFDKRQLSRPGRFSLDGVPSLYLANSLSSGYLECRAASMAHFQAAKFQNKIALKLLNLDYHLEPLTSDEIELNHQRLGVLYPFYAACFTIYADGSNFIEEYTLSTMVTQWVKQRGIFDGILYPSTKTPPPNFSDRFINLVFPPKTDAASGHCTYLKDKVFHMSDGCAWMRDQAAIGTYFAANFPAVGVINPDVNTIEWPAGSGPSRYEETEIGQMEFFMHHHDDMMAKTIDF